MKSLFSRSLFVAFLVVTGLTYSYAQTTVNLPTIPCSNCNGPGAFATTAPACTSGLVGAPLTMSWGAASGATSYTIMIATDAALSQNVATYTQTGTSISVPAVGLKPQTTYYWTVFANNATGSTKATGGVCTFSTNTTWKGTSPTGGFPNGTWSQVGVNIGRTGGYYTCQSGDGTCASGDNLICNPTFISIASTNYLPHWSSSFYPGNGCPATYWGARSIGVDLVLSGAGTPTSGSGTTTGAYFPNNYSIYQPMLVTNTTAATQTYRLTFSGRAGNNTGASWNMGFVGGGGASVIPTGTWAQYNVTMTLAPNAQTSAFYFDPMDANADTYFNGWITDLVLCRL